MAQHIFTLSLNIEGAAEKVSQFLKEQRALKK
jgi:hypothetical protein